MPLKFAAVNNRVVFAAPTGQRFGVDKANFGCFFWQTKMRDARHSESAFLHNSVTGCSRPTRFNSQTSHSLMNFEKGADHVRCAALKAMRIFTLDGDAGPVSHNAARDLDHCVKEPADANFAYRIICGLETQIFGDVLATDVAGFRGLLAKHLRPYLIEFGHMARIGRRTEKGNFVILF